MAMFGLELPEIPEPTDVLIDKDNWDSVMLFFRLSTQWVYGAMGGVIGLNYAGVKAVLDLIYPKKKHAALFDDIQVMERAAATLLNEKSEAQR